MRYAVFSDIHSNLPALEAVLEDANQNGFDEIICLGDMVGYGPNPNECMDTLFAFPNTSIAGNHDWGAIDKVDLVIFNRDARQALNWTRSELSHEHNDILSDLPVSQPVMDGILLSHGSPRKPVWEYLVDIKAATANFDKYEFELALVGHTHLPLVFELNSTKRVRHIMPEVNEPLEYAGKRMILNPGSVGQPRDMNPHASYAILDTQEKHWTFHRVIYPVEETQKRMHELKLPLRLIARLSVGR